MDSRQLAAIDARLTALEARVEKLAGGQIDRPDRADEQRAPVSNEAILLRLRELVDAAGGLLPGNGDEAGRSDCLLLVATADRTGRQQAQVTTLGVIVADEDDNGIAGLAAAAASPLRITILKLLANGERSARDIGLAVSLEGGPLYHHLRALTAAHLVHQPERSRYRLSDGGLRLLLSLGSVHRQMRCAGGLSVDADEGGAGDE